MPNFTEEYGVVAEKLVGYVRDKTTDRADETYQLDVSRYTSPERWSEEMERIYYRVPLLAGLSIEIPNSGDYKAYDYLGKPIVLTRLPDGGVSALLNVCTHRGMMVVPEGTGNARLFSCPYHGWTFKGNGALLGVAEKAKFGAADDNCRSLTRLPVHEQAGLIFVVLTADLDVDFDGFFAGVLDDAEAAGLSRAHFIGTREIQGANWKVAYDGYLEGYHFAAAHPDTIHPRTFSNIMQFDAFGPHVRVGFPQQSILQQLEDLPRSEWGSRENYGYDFVRTIFPNVSLFAAPEIIQISQIIPGPTHDKNTTIMYFASRNAPKDDGDSEKLTEMMEFLTEVVRVEDFGVGLKVQRGLESGAISSVIFGRNERGNQYFHRWVDYLVNGATGEPPVL